MKIEKMVLVIEDDLCINDLITELLKDLGYATKSFFNGEEAYLWLSDVEIKPDLILLDLMMPKKNGYLFRDDQLNDQILKEIPVVVMSADGNFSQNKTRIKANEYLKKPFELNDFTNIVSKYLEG